MNDYRIIDDYVAPGPPAEAAVGAVFEPARALRRTQSGKVCPACGVRMHHADVVALRTEDHLIYLHGQCALAIAERADSEANDLAEMEEQRVQAARYDHLDES